MQIRERIYETTVVLYPCGIINAVESILLTRKVENYKGTGYNRILIDLNKVEFVDSTTIGGFIYLTKTMKKSGIDVVLCAPRKQIQELFRNFCLEDVLKIEHRVVLNLQPSLPEDHQVD